MFDSISAKLQKTFRDLRGLGKISEANVGDALREVRMALLEADVNFKVVKAFVERVRERAVGQDVLTAFSPAQQVTKIVRDELQELLGGSQVGLAIVGTPAVVMMAQFVVASRRRRQVVARSSSPRSA